MNIEKETLPSKEETIKAIINDCDKRKKLTHQQKEELAKYLVQECEIRLQIAKNLLSEREISSTLQEGTATSALKSIRSLHKEIKGSLMERDAEMLYRKTYEKLNQGSSPIGIEGISAPIFSLGDVVVFLETLSLFTSHVQSEKQGSKRERATQDRTYIGDFLAMWIANSYFKLLGHKPASRGFGDSSPYDRICDHISHYLNMEKPISRTSMRKAANSFDDF